MSEERYNYYELQSNGNIVWCSVLYQSTYESNLHIQGNLFLTKEEAERERDRRSLLNCIDRFRYKCQGDWKPDWTRWSQFKYCIYWNGDTLLAATCELNFEFNIFGYFKKHEDCLAAIGEFGDEIKRLYVEELKK